MADKTESKPSFWASDSEESFSCGPFDTREEAMAAAVAEFDLEPGDNFWTCEADYTTETYPPVADRVIEDAQERACDDTLGADWVETWLDDVPRGEMEDLDAMLEATWNTWLDKYNLRPQWFTSCKVQAHKVPEGEKP
ncbi:MAG: hypothetical protein WC683_03150 [bacterium]